MENAIHVGNKVDKETGDNLKEIIETIFVRGHENRIDQATMQAAIEMIRRVTSVEDTVITNCVFNADGSKQRKED